METAEVRDVLARAQALVDAARVGQHAEDVERACRRRLCASCRRQDASAVGLHQRVEHASVVVLPAPFGPSRPVISPSAAREADAVDGVHAVRRGSRRTCAGPEPRSSPHPGPEAITAPTRTRRQTAASPSGAPDSRTSSDARPRCDELADQPRHATRRHHVVTLTARDEMASGAQRREHLVAVARRRHRIELTGQQQRRPVADERRMEIARACGRAARRCIARPMRADEGSSPSSVSRPGGSRDRAAARPRCSATAAAGRGQLFADEAFHHRACAIRSSGAPPRPRASVNGSIAASVGDVGIQADHTRDRCAVSGLGGSVRQRIAIRDHRRGSRRNRSSSARERLVRRRELPSDAGIRVRSAAS